mmetsp:Transcript_34349/g.83123  ORF Transcript_34349/g.83123 Transcript_34349/m.83123 type:complete len:229 (-) Transcript_34349:329-1015(-)
MAENKKPPFVKKQFPTPYNKAGAQILESALRKTKGKMVGEVVDLQFQHKQKGTLVLAYKGKREDITAEDLDNIRNTACGQLKTQYEGNELDLKEFFIINYKVKKGKLEVSYAVHDAARVQLSKQKAKQSSIKTNKKKSKKSEGKFSLQPRSIVDLAMDDVLTEVLSCLKSSNVDLPEGKGMGELKVALEKAVRPSLVTFQNQSYAQGLASAVGTPQPPTYNLFDAPTK